VTTYVAAAALLCLGWRLFWFLTDDAFIAFRYVHNASVGRGLVWNPAPFLPVEGYTSFSWVLLLLGLQQAFHVSPVDASNWLGLGLGLASLAIIVAVLFRVAIPARWQSRRLVLAALTLGGMLSNRTYLAWQSSGLETPLFNALLTAWLALLIWPYPSAPGRRLLALCSLASLAALTRPDGVLFALASAAFVVVRAAAARRKSSLWALAPLLLVPVHVAWRLRFYGQWWPNTYYAKYSGAWPESGLRYLGCFVLEYALYLPLGLALGLGVGALRRRRLPASNTARRLVPTWLRQKANEPEVVAWVTVLVHLSSITFGVGGDHFEYRPYSYLVPWLWLGCLRLAELAFVRWQAAAAFLAAAWLLSLPIPWQHWRATHQLYRREETHYLHARVAPLLPAPLSYVAAIWDDWQGWLIAHYVCMRHQEHKAFLLHQLEFWASREQGARLPWTDHDVLFATAVGVPGWVFPNVAVIDMLGLNDYVIAHSPVGGSFHRMAHDRWPPNNYVRCFRPNVDGFRASFYVLPRSLSDDDIRRCERRFRAALEDKSWAARN
jgi:arabinofuranosyltransferase